MTRITTYRPPPELKPLLRTVLTARKATHYASAAIALTPGGTRPDTVKTRPLSELDFTPVADWLLAHGPAAWRGASAGATRAAILASIATRRFDPDFWRGPAPVTDRIEVAYPTIVRPSSAPPDPNDPSDIANTQCRYTNRATYWPYAQARAGGWPPLPGWSGSTDANRWFVDDWHAQRALTFAFPATTLGTSPRPWLIHVQGTLRASAEESGLRLWFAPVAWPQFFTTQASADATADTAAELYTRLVDQGLVLPAPANGWSHAHPLDLVFRINPPRYYPWHGSARWLNLKLSTRAPCGKYRAANAWARLEIDATVRVYYPAFLG